jgi:hypothetical protein
MPGFGAVEGVEKDAGEGTDADHANKNVTR